MRLRGGRFVITSVQHSVAVPRTRLEVTAGSDRGLVVEVALPAIRIGRTGADVELSDSTVSGLHCEIAVLRDGFRVRDLASTNGTYVSGVRVVEAVIRPGATLQLGRAAIRLQPLADPVAAPLWKSTRLRQLIGASVAMRRLFEVIDRLARADTTVLILGETGTGKELVADALHQCSPRHAAPLVVLDCSAIPERLVEAQLFGYEVGAFTGAVRATPGVFEAAHQGTLFLDEVGELPLEIQAKLLRAVETRTVRRLGGTRTLAADVRVLAATNRDLAAEVNRGTFRSDLYYRLAVARVDVPPLRDRREDVPLLVEHFVQQLAERAAAVRLLPDFLDRALRHAWPGNVRELRNAIERAALLETDAGLEVIPYDPPEQEPEIDVGTPFRTAKQQVIDAFDRRYLRALLDAHGGNITTAASAAGIGRMAIYKMIRRLGFEIG